MVCAGIAREWGFGLASPSLGDVVFAKIFQRPVLVLNSLRAAQDLLEKKSANYSDRPRLILLAELYAFSFGSSRKSI